MEVKGQVIVTTNYHVSVDNQLMLHITGCTLIQGLQDYTEYRVYQNTGFTIFYIYRVYQNTGFTRLHRIQGLSYYIEYRVYQITGFIRLHRIQGLSDYK